METRIPSSLKFRLFHALLQDRGDISPGIPDAWASKLKKDDCSRRDRESSYDKGGAISRFLFLNPPFIYATYPLTSAGQASSVSIFGLAGPLAAPDGHRCHIAVGSCPTFSPLPLWAVIFCCGRMRLLPSRLSPAGRPFLSGLSSPSHLLRHCCFRRLRGAADCPTSVFRGTKVRKKIASGKILTPSELLSSR